MTELKKFESFYRMFREVSKVVHSTSKTDLNEVLKLIVSNTTQGLGAKGAAICIFNKDSDNFHIRASYGIDEKYIALEPLTGKRFMSWPDKNHSIQIITDIKNAHRVKYPQEAWDIGIRMMVDVPLVIDNMVFGFIRTYFNKKKTFSDDELDFTKAVTEQCACAIDHNDRIKFYNSRYNQLATKIDRLSSLGRMAAGIAHEINNPLTGILLYSSNLFKKASEDGQFKDGLEIIMEETQRCKTIIQGLLDFSREKKPEKVDANINKVIEKALALMENEFFIKRIQIKKNLDPDIVNFQLDDNQIEQVLINMLLNAIHAVNEKGRIGIRSKMDKENESVLIEIQDNGHGIPQDKLKKIFEPFYTTKTTGTGLGLAVSYGIIKNHKGKVKILSEKGTGTLITIKLPIISKPKENTSKG